MPYIDGRIDLLLPLSERKPKEEMHYLQPGSIVSLHKKALCRPFCNDPCVRHVLNHATASGKKNHEFPLMRVLNCEPWDDPRAAVTVRIPLVPGDDLSFQRHMLVQEFVEESSSSLEALMQYDYEDFKVHRCQGLSGVNFFVNVGFTSHKWQDVHIAIKKHCKENGIWVFTDKKFGGPKPTDGRARYVFGFYSREECDSVGRVFRRDCTGTRTLVPVRGTNARVGMRVCQGPSWRQGSRRIAGWQEHPRWNVADGMLGTITRIYMKGSSFDCMVLVSWDELEAGPFWYRAGTCDGYGIEYVDLFEAPPPLIFDPSYVSKRKRTKLNEATDACARNREERDDLASSSSFSSSTKRQRTEYVCMYGVLNRDDACHV
jgi:hypothetical protein